MTNKLKDLKSFLDNNTIPKSKKRPKTFLGISKQPHYENVLSNIYAFFFNVNEVHKLEDLFIKSLLELISDSKLGVEKGKLQSFGDYDINTEYTTQKGGRIDLLLSNREQAILIENKVYHHIKKNDLDDYWNSIKIDNDEKENKIGIILSLKPVSETSYSRFKQRGDYINITHLELLNCVMKNSKTFLTNASTKYVTFLEDLDQNIKNISNTTMENGDVSFYFENQEKINKLIAFKKHLRLHLENQVLFAGYQLNNIQAKPFTKKSSHGDRIVNYHATSDNNLMIMVIYGDLMKAKPSLTIKIKMQGKLVADTNRNLFYNISLPQELKKLQTQEFKFVNQGYLHFGGKEYFPTQDDILDLPNYIIKALQDDKILETFRSMEKCLPL